MKFRLDILIFDYELKNFTVLKEADLSDKTGINRTTINRIKLNAPGMNPRLSTLISLCRFFDCTIDDLVDISDDDEI